MNVLKHFLVKIFIRCILLGAAFSIFGTACAEEVDEYGQFSTEELFDKMFRKGEVKIIKMPKSGITHVTLYINEQYFDELEVKLQGEDFQYQTVYSIYSKELGKLFQEVLKKEISEQIVLENGKYLISSLNEAGIETEFVKSSMRLLMKLPASFKHHREIDLWRESNWYLKTDAIGPADTSGFVNFFMETKLLEPSGNKNKFEVTDNSPDYYFPIDKFAGLVQYIFNYHSWVLDGYSIINWRDENARRVNRGKTKITKPLAENAKFITFGDLEYKVSGFLDYKPMLGISYYTDFYSQPYFQTQYLGQEQIFLQNPSEVEIFINDHRSKKLNLDSGSYDLKQFALNEGVNDVKLRITDQTGYTEVRSFNLITYQENLRKGLHEFSYNVGVESQLGSPNSYSDNLRAVFFHRYGLTNNFTIGGSGNLNEHTQLLSVAGTYGNAYGVFNYDVALWHAKHYDGHGYNIAQIGQYAYNTRGKTLSSVVLQARKFGDRFKRLNHNPDKFRQDIRKNIDWDFNILSDLKLKTKTTLALAFRTTKYHKERELKQDATATFFHNFGPVGFRFASKYNFRDDDFTVSLSISRRFGRSSYATHYDSENKKYELEYTKYPLSRTHSVALSADAEYYEDCPNSLYYDAMYSTYRAKFDIFGKYVNDTDRNYDAHELGARVATAIAYSGGKFAITRPISRSFAIVSYKNENAFNKLPLGINPVTEGDKISYAAQINKFGHAVLPDIGNYLYADVRIDATTLPMGYDLAKSNYVILPTFYSGINVELENTIQVIGVAKLKLESGEDMPLVTGYTTKKSAPVIGKSTESGVTEFTNRNLFFSDRSGMVQFDKLEPGEYKLEVVHEEKTYYAEFTVPQSVENGIYKMGDIVTYEVIE